MGGLILKDFFNIRKDLKSYLLVIIFYIAITMINKMPEMIGAVMCVLCTMMPTNSMAVDEKVGWNTYALSTTVSRKDLVLSKYIFGIICSLIGAIISASIIIATKGFSLDGIILAILLWSISIVFLSLALPVSLIFGFEKGRVLLTLLIVTPTIIGFTLLKNFNVNINLDFINSISNSLPVLLVLTAVVFMIISLCISLKVYNKKQF